MSGNRDSIRARFQSVRDRGDFLVGAAVGAGLFAEAAEHGGADFVLALNAGRLRLMGAASASGMLPIRDANQFVESFGPAEFLGRCSGPVFFGASVLHPEEDAAAIAARVAALGFAGVMNFPSSVHYPAAMQLALDRWGLGFEKELAMLRAAAALDLWTVAHVRTCAQAEAAALAGCDMICFDLGWNTGGRHGVTTAVTLSEAAFLLREASRVVGRVNRHALLLVEGGPIETVEDLLSVYSRAQISGYVGGSTIDRLPLEDAVVNQTLRFKSAAAAKRRSVEQDRSLVEIGRSMGFAGRSPRMTAFLQTLSRFARNAVGPTFVVSGEPGSQRQRTVEGLFQLNGGDPGKLVTINARELSAQQLIIAIFGHSRQPGHGAAGHPQVKGLVIRELRHVSLYSQRRIARYLERGRFRPMGGQREISSEMQVLFTSSTPLHQLAEEGRLDPELHAQLESRELWIPPLREHVEDLEYLLGEAFDGLGTERALPKLSPAALRRLQTHSWTGNLAELRAFAGRLASADVGERLDEALVARLLDASPSQAMRPGTERDVIIDALWRNGFHRGRTANFLGISRKSLYNKIVRYQLMG